MLSVACSHQGVELWQTTVHNTIGAWHPHACVPCQSSAQPQVSVARAEDPSCGSEPLSSCAEFANLDANPIDRETNA